MPVATYTKTGNKSTAAAKLDKAVFAVAVDNHELLKRAYVAYMANARENLATTKQRGEVRGGGKKPWRQKGTGRARFGSSRNPIWRGGGVVFGPRGNENHSKKINQKTKQAAIRQALTLAAKEDRLIVIEDFAPKDAKTAQAAKLLDKIGAKGNVLLVVDTKTAEQQRSVANLPNVKLIRAQFLSVFELLNADSLVITSKAMAVITDWLGGTAK